MDTNALGTHTRNHICVSVISRSLYSMSRPQRLHKPKCQGQLEITRQQQDILSGCLKAGCLNTLYFILAYGWANLHLGKGKINYVVRGSAVQQEFCRGLLKMCFISVKILLRNDKYSVLLINRYRINPSSDC